MNVPPETRTLQSLDEAGALVHLGFIARRMTEDIADGLETLTTVIAENYAKSIPEHVREEIEFARTNPASKCIGWSGPRQL